MYFVDIERFLLIKICLLYTSRCVYETDITLDEMHITVERNKVDIKSKINVR